MARRPWLPPRRGRIVQPPASPAPQPLAVTRERVQPALRARRGQFFQPPWLGIATPGTQALPPQALRARVNLPRLPRHWRGRIVQPPWVGAAAAAPPAYVPQVLRCHVQPPRQRARARCEPPWTAQGPPPPFMRQRARGGVPARRGRFLPVPAQPGYVPQVLRCRVRPPRYHRGHLFQPPYLAPVPPAYPPQFARARVRLPRQFRTKMAHGRWIGAAPAVFTIGALTAGDRPDAVLTVSAGSGVLTATGAGLGVLTAATIAGAGTTALALFDETLGVILDEGGREVDTEG